MTRYIRTRGKSKKEEHMERVYGMHNAWKGRRNKKEEHFRSVILFPYVRDDDDGWIYCGVKWGGKPQWKKRLGVSRVPERPMEPGKVACQTLHPSFFLPRKKKNDFLCRSAINLDMCACVSLSLFPLSLFYLSRTDKRGIKESGCSPELDNGEPYIRWGRKLKRESDARVLAETR